MYKEFTLVLYKLPFFNWKTVRVKEMGIWHGFICMQGVRTMLPRAAELLEQGKIVKVIVGMKEEI